MPTISVVIATYNRATLLDDCLRHLRSQSFHPGDEVLIVDNASTDHTSHVVRALQSDWPVPLRLLHEPQPGKSYALRRALAAARCDVLGFLDDDVRVTSAWLDTVRRVMSGSSVALMGGRVLPQWQESVPKWLRNAPDGYKRLGAPLGLLDYPADVVALGPRTVLGANMAVRRSVFDAVGGFSTRVGKLRGTLLSGEDHELCQRVQAQGFSAIYVPDAVVYHWVPAERTRVRYFLHWFYWSGITNAILENASALPRYLVKRSLLSTLDALRSLLIGNRTRALDAALDVAFAAGYAAHCYGFASTRTPATQVRPEAA